MKKMSLCGLLIRRIRKIQILLIFLIIAGAGETMLFAQEEAAASKFKQRLEWSADKNAFEYKVEIRSDGNILQTFNTSDNFVNLNLPAGNYDYRVTVYDFLGRQQDVSAWQKFEISKANLPAFNNMQKTADFDIAAGDKITLPVEVDNISAAAKVSLVNTETGETVAGTLVMQGAATGMSEIGSAHAEFPLVSSGEWKLVVTNPSGLSAESEGITIKTHDSKAITLAKAEEKKRAEEAKKEAEQQVAKELHTNKMYVLVEDDEEEDEEADAAELIEEVVEETEEEIKEELEDAAPRRPYRVIGLEVKAGAGLVANLFDSDLLSLKNEDAFFKGDMPNNITLAPLAAISYVPNFDWRIKPGIELSASGFYYFYRSPGYKNLEWEYLQEFCYNNVQLTLIGQVKLLPQKIFLDVRAGGGITEILMATNYAQGRGPTEKAFTYAKMNAGLAFEFVPFKYLVIEVGGDYNKILSSKINYSYLMPYLEVGVRF